jgi:hypothetical protein
MDHIESTARDTVLCAVLPRSTCGRFGGIAPQTLPGFWRTFEKAAPLPLRLTVRAAVLLTLLAPVFVGQGVHLFGGLSPAQRDVTLRRLAASRFYTVRQCVAVLKLCACFAAFSQPGVRAGYPGAS